VYGPGFLQPTSTFGADLNLIVQLLGGALLLVGVALVRRARYAAHGACQSTALLVALVLTVLWMAPAFHEVYLDGLARRVLNRVNVVAVAHVVAGSAALLLGVWVALVAGTPLVPARWRFTDYKTWMRTLLAVWWLAILLGVATYWLSTH
jgi:uncharacterized membrane protein YozB (DUF420 family)